MYFVQLLKNGYNRNNKKVELNTFYFIISAFGLLGGGRQRSARSRMHHQSPYHHPAHHQQHQIGSNNALANPFRSPFADFGMSPFGLLGKESLQSTGSADSN